MNNLTENLEQTWHDENDAWTPGNHDHCQRTDFFLSYRKLRRMHAVTPNTICFEIEEIN